MNSITSADKLKSLRAEMAKDGLDGFVIPRSDEFLGEYVPPSAERLAWFTGFTGSAGISVALQSKAVVMTDGRYQIQIRQQVNAAQFEIADSQAESAGAWIARSAAKGAVIGYDPRLHTAREIEVMEESLRQAGMTLKAVNDNPIDRLWQARPAPPAGKVSIFPDSIAGRSLHEKKQIVMDAVTAKGGAAGVVALSDSIAWMLNIRGDDLKCVPVALSHAIVNALDGQIEWFVDAAKIPPDVMAHLGNSVIIRSPSDLDKRLVDIAAAAKAVDKPVLLDPARSPIYFRQALGDAGAKVADYKDPCIDPRAQKTSAEKAGIEKAHVLDGAAVVKFLHWLDGAVPSAGISEIDVENKLEGFRKESPEYKGPSFDTIAGFAGNGAITHYRATPQTSKMIDTDGLLLVDSGGQYPFGTTDITRTIAIGTPSDEMRVNFTRVLKGHFAIAMAQFPSGTTGQRIDSLGRAPLWAAGLDFDHGTGHGVGCYLSVHEEAASISPRGQEPLKPGMLISNEPGFYKEGEYGIRIENLVMVEEAGNRIDKKSTVMLKFNTVTLAPYDRRMIKSDMLNAEEKQWLNNYHARVYTTLKPLLNTQQADWLRDSTQPIP